MPQTQSENYSKAPDIDTIGSFTTNELNEVRHRLKLGTTKIKSKSEENCTKIPSQTRSKYAPVDLWVQFIFSITFIMTFFISFKAFQHSPYKIISMLILSVTIHWMLLFLMILFSTKHLHFIYVESAPFNATSEQSHFLSATRFPKEIKHKAIVSVSLLHALRGTNMSKLAAFMGYIHFSLVLAAVIMNWDHNKYENTLWQPVLLSGCIGCFIMVSFELQANMLSNCMHYLGVVLTAPAGPISFGLQQNWNIWCLVILLTIIIFTVIWMLVAFCWKIKYTKHSQQYHKSVHLKSKCCILLEVALVFLSDLTVVLAIYNM